MRELKERILRSLKVKLSTEKDKNSENNKEIDYDIKNIHIYQANIFDKKELFELVFSFTNNTKNYVLFGKEIDKDDTTISVNYIINF